MSNILGLDIGGANTKYTLINEETNELLLIGSEYFPLWKKYKSFITFLRKIKNRIIKRFGTINQVVFVTTAELADCFKTKKDGIEKICNNIKEVFQNENLPLIYDINGDFISIDKAPQKWNEVSATNWMASAEYIGRTKTNSILIDIGSTTTDIIPIYNGKVVTKGKNDLERLMHHELIYSGLLRTNVATILHEIKLKNQIIPLSSELFATTGDVYLILEMISNNEFTVETTDGGIVSKENSLIRLARIVCSDINQLTYDEIKDIAQQIMNKQLNIISIALKHVFNNYKKEYGINPEIILIGSGANNLGVLLVQKNKIKDWIIATDILSVQTLNCFTAYAVAKLFVIKNKSN